MEKAVELQNNWQDHFYTCLYHAFSGHRCFLPFYLEDRRRNTGSNFHHGRGQIGGFDMAEEKRKHRKKMTIAEIDAEIAKLTEARQRRKAADREEIGCWVQKISGKDTLPEIKAWLSEHGIDEHEGQSAG